MRREDNHPGAEVVAYRITVALDQDAILVAARGDGADFETILLAALEQLDCWFEPVLVEQHVVFDEADVISSVTGQIS